MGKNIKNSATKAKPITDFFPRKHPGSSQTTASQRSTRATGTNSPQNVSKNTEVTSVGSLLSPGAPKMHMNATFPSLSTPKLPKTRTSLAVPKIMSPGTPKNISNTSRLTVTSSIPLKRSHSPEAQAEKCMDAPRSPGKKRSVFDSDSEVEQLNSTVYVKPRSSLLSSSSQPSAAKSPLKIKENIIMNGTQLGSDSRKKPRFESLVPSSQSDEDELHNSLHQQDGSPTRNKNGSWRKGAFPSLEKRVQDRLFSSSKILIPSQALPPSQSISEPKVSNTPMEPLTPMSDRSITPPPTHQSSPMTPLALDVEAKTAQIIAQIKANAYASLSSPEDTSIGEFNNVLDDSDDEEEVVSMLPVDKGKSGSLPTPPDNQTIDLSLIKNNSNVYQLRSKSQRMPMPLPNRSPSPSTSRPKPDTRTRRPVHMFSIKGARPPTKKVPLLSNPLDALLKEKRLAMKCSQGKDAFKLAEKIVSKSGRVRMLKEMDYEDDNLWEDEETTNLLREKCDRMLLKSSSPLSDGHLSDHLVFEEEDRKRLFGNDGGKDIMKILISEREEKAKEIQSARALGIDLWTRSRKVLGEAMDTDQAFPTFEFTGGDPVLKLLQGVTDDFTKASLLINSGILSAVAVDHRPALTTYLCNLTFMPIIHDISVTAFHALLGMIDQNTALPISGLSFSDVMTYLCRLGAQTSVFKAMGWTVHHEFIPSRCDTEMRENVLYRLVSLLQANAVHLAIQEIPDMVMILLLMAMDRSTTPALQQNIVEAIDTLCSSIASNQKTSAEVESALCNKILICVSDYTPINKGYLLSFLTSGTDRTRRIASWVANMVIADKYVITPTDFSGMPPLSNILEQFERSGTSDIPGKFQLRDETNFADLEAYAHVLGIATLDIKGYVNEEATAKEAPVCLLSSSPSKQLLEKPKSSLEAIHTHLEKLHSRIVDTRAARLDRSRAKEALKAISLRIHYQYNFMLKRKGKGLRAHASLDQFFAPKNF